MRYSRVFVWGNSMLFDTHCHLNDEKLYSRRDEVIKNALEVGVERFLCVGWDLESSLKAISVSHEYGGVYAAVGIHPENIGDLSLETALEEIEKMASDPKVIAIGEIGLDYHWFKEEKDRERQKTFFKAQIALANKLHLPASIHARDASQETFDMLSNNPIERGCSLHCYSGSPEMLLRFAKLGCYFGFDGPITFKNAIIPKEALKVCPIDRILLETDSPYLAPTPYRGHENEPKFLNNIAEFASEIMGVQYDDLCDKTCENAFKLFHVK